MPGPPSDGYPTALIQHLRHDPSEHTRGCAALALGQSQETSALEPLLQALYGPSPWVRGWSAYAQGRLQEPNTLPDVVNQLFWAGLLRSHLVSRTCAWGAASGPRSPIPSRAQDTLTAWRNSSAVRTPWRAKTFSVRTRCTSGSRSSQASFTTTTL